MKRAKKIVASILALFMAFSSTPMSALADEITNLYPDDVYQYFVEGTINGDKNLYFGFNPDYKALYIGYERGKGELTGTYSYLDTDHTGDANYLNMKITGCDEDSPFTIGEYYNFEDFSYDSVAILNNVTSIDNVDFSRFNTEEIFFEDYSEITHIGDYVFKDCPIYYIDNLPELETIGEYAFYNSSLVDFAVPDKCTDIGDYAFAKSDIESFKFHTVTDFSPRYGRYMAAECEKLDTVMVYSETVIPSYCFKDSPVKRVSFSKNSNSIIGDYAFENTKLTSVYVYNVDTIFEKAFYGIDTLTSVEFRGYIDNIDDYAFSHCNLKNVKFSYAGPEYCRTSIRKGAFSDNPELESIVIPGYVEEIHEKAFANCTNLSNVEYRNIYTAVDGVSKVLKTNYVNKTAFDNTLVDYDSIPYKDYASYRDNKDIKVVDLSNEKHIALSSYCFANCSNLETVILPDYITTIPNYCFQNCPNLKSVKLPADLERIGSNAFRGCESLQGIDIPDGVEYIGEYAFYNCVSLKSIKLPSLISKIPSNCFSGTSITELVIPVLVESIDANAFVNVPLKTIVAEESEKTITLVSDSFYKCRNIESVNFNGRVKKIPPSAFAEMDGLHTFNFDGVTTIQNEAFKDTSLTNVNIPSECYYIGQKVFYGCASIESLTFGEGVDLRIDKSAFYSCTNIESVVFTTRVKYILSAAFKNCSRLNNVEFDKLLNDNNEYVYGVRLISQDAFENTPANSKINIDDYLNNADDSTPNQPNITDFEYDHLYTLGTNTPVYKMTSQITNEKFAAVLSDDVVRLDDYAFENCTNLVVVYIPASVKAIGQYAFKNCTMLEAVIFEDGSEINTIPDGVFSGCRSLYSIVLPQSVKHIWNNVFDHCTSLQDFCLPRNLESLGRSSFYYSGIVSVDIPASLTEIDDFAFFCAESLTKVTLPTSMTVIPFGMFDNCSSLKNITLHEGITKIDSNAFYGTGLTNVVLPSTIEELGYGTFAYTNLETFDMSKTKLTSTGVQMLFHCNIGNFVFNDELNELGAGTFQYSNITNYVVPDQIKIIGDDCFRNSAITSITVHPNVESIGAGAFMDTAIKTIDLSSCSKLKSIGDYFAYGCKKLTSVSLPDSIEYIGESAFESCILTSFTTPNSLKEVGNAAFLNTKFNSFVVPKGVVKIGDYAFGSDSTKKSFTLTVFNKNLVLNDKMFRSKSSATNTTLVLIKALNNSKAQEYAEKNSIEFRAIDENGNPICIRYYSGTYNSGSWEIREESSVSSTVEFKGNGNIDPSSFVDSNGEVVDLTSLMNECNVNNIVFPNGITTIPAGLFNGMTNIKIINIPEGVQTIGDHAFENCSVVDVTFPSSLRTIGAYAFYNSSVMLSKYANIDTFNDGLVRICDYAFSGTKVYFLTLPNSVTSLGVHAFDNASVNQVKFGAGIKNIPDYCFANNIVMSNVTIPYGITSIGMGAFINCIHLYDYYISSSVVNIYNKTPRTSAIGGNTDGTRVVCRIHCAFNSAAYKYAKIYDDISYVLDYGADSELNTKNASTWGTFADTTNKWYYFADKDAILFTGVGSLTDTKMLLQNGDDFTIESLRNVKYPKAEYDAEVEKSKENGVELPKWKDLPLSVDTVYIQFGIAELNTRSNNGTAFAQVNPKNIVIPESLTALKGKQFLNCTNLIGIDIPDTVTTIGTDAFNGCTGLESVKIGKGLNEITREMFSSSSKLKYLEIAEGIKKIGDKAFYRCTNLESVYVPNSVTMIGDQAFYQCYGLKTITIGSSVNYIGYQAFSDAVLCERLTINTPKVSYNYSDGKLDSKEIFRGIGDSTTGVKVKFGDNVINANLGVLNNHNVGAIELGSKVETIQNATDLIFLEEINVSSENKHLKSVDNCLYYDTKLILVSATKTEVDIADDTTSIGANAFSSSLVSSVSLPNNLVEIDDSAFKNATKLKRISVPSSVTSIGNSAFENCVSLRTINIGENVATIGDNAFKDCSKLPTIILDENLVSIGSGAFNGCSKLEGLVIPRNVSQIGDGAFAQCPILENIFVWYAEIGANNFKQSRDINVWVLAATMPYAYVRENNIHHTVYNDADLFKDLCAANVDIYAGFLGFCDGVHGDIEWLTVYESDCENDGYMIGVCEYCSEIIEEKHITATGHMYSLIADIPATEYTSGRQIFTCTNCNEKYTTFTPPTGYFAPEMHTVKGKITLAEDKNASPTVNAISGAKIICNGEVIAITNNKGYFDVSLDSGVYELTISYTYGIDRTIFVVVENADVDCGTISILGCDFNKDGSINEDDYILFMYVISSKTDDESYLSFVDLNNDGYINARDRLIVRACLGVDNTFTYDTMVIKA